MTLCEECKREVKPPTQDAVKEAIATWGKHEPDDIILCDDCYERFMREIRN